ENGAGLTCLRIDKGVAVQAFTLDAQGTFTDSLGPEADARYLVYGDGASLPEGSLSLEGLPASGTSLSNLENGDGKTPEYLIIAPRVLLEPALALRDFRASPDRALPLRTEVVAVEDIYRQYSGGRMSPVAIRDFLR